MPAGAERDAVAARSRELLEESLADFHEALSIWYGFELSSRSLGAFARQVEMNTSNVCFLLDRGEEALFHADEALLIPGVPIPELDYDRAHALLRLDFAPQAIDAMSKARNLGFGGQDQELWRFFLRAGRRCEQQGLLGKAEEGYRVALEAAAPGPQRDEARKALDALLSKPAPEPAGEKARIAEMDARLAKLVLACPAPRGPRPLLDSK
jgi:hypothetical protein